MTFKSYISNFLKIDDSNVNKLTKWKSWTKENRQQGSSILILDADKERTISYMDSKDFSYNEILNHIKKDKAN